MSDSHSERNYVEERNYRRSNFKAFVDGVYSLN